MIKRSINATQKNEAKSFKKAVYKNSEKTPSPQFNGGPYARWYTSIANFRDGILDMSLGIWLALNR